MRTIIDAVKSQSNDYTNLENLYLEQTGKSLLTNEKIKNTKVTKNETLKVSVIIPAWNVEHSVLRCLKSIEKSSFNKKYPDKLEIIIIDDGSDDNTFNLIKTSLFSINLKLARQKHKSISHARNLGINLSTGAIIIFCDADMVLSKKTIENLENRHRLLPNVLLVGFRSNGDTRIKFKVAGTPENMCLASNNFKKLGNGKSLLMPDGDNWLLSDLVYGALFSISKATCIKLGGYDENFLGWGCEDGFFASKAIASGCKIVPIYSATGLHIDHPPRNKNQQDDYERNRLLFNNYLVTQKVGNYTDYISKTKSRITDYFSNNSFNATL